MVPDDHRVKLKESEKKSTWALLGNWIKRWNIKVMVIPIIIGVRYNHWKINTGTGGFENKRTSGDHPNKGIVQIGHNTEKSPGNLRRFAVTQTPLRNHQLTLMWKKISKEKNNNHIKKKKLGIWHSGWPINPNKKSRIYGRENWRTRSLLQRMTNKQKWPKFILALCRRLKL